MTGHRIQAHLYDKAEAADEHPLTSAGLHSVAIMEPLDPGHGRVGGAHTLHVDVLAGCDVGPVNVGAPAEADPGREPDLQLEAGLDAGARDQFVLRLAPE